MISCVSYVVRKTCITLGKFLEFLGLRLLDLIGLIFNVAAFCTVIRIPGLVDALFNDGGKFKWRWKYVGIWQLFIFIMDLPLLISLPFYVICPWRIYLVYAGIIKHKEFEKLRWEGWKVRKRVLKHFILLLFDLLSIPFTICLALSWRCLRCYNLLSKCDKKEKTVKFIIVCQFLHLLCDIIVLPFVTVLMFSWRAPIIVKKLIKIYFTKPEVSHAQQVSEVSQLDPEEQLPQSNSSNDVEYANEHDLKMKGIIIQQMWSLTLDILCLPAMFMTVFSWRSAFFLWDCTKKLKTKSPISLNKTYAYIRWKFWQNSVYFFMDLPCVLALVMLFVLFPILPWRLMQYLDGFKARLFVSSSSKDRETDDLKNSKQRQMHERRLLIVTFPIIAADIVSILAATVTAVSLWRLPFLLHDLRKIKKTATQADIGTVGRQYGLKRSSLIWKVCIINLILLFADILCAVLSLIIFCTVWRAYPLFCSIKSSLSPRCNDKVKDDLKQASERISIFAINGMKIRKSMLKHFVFLLLDVPAILLCLLHVPFVIKIPAIISVVLGGNFYLEFAVTVYMETAKLLVDILFLFVLIFMCFVRPVAIWVHVLEDERHKKYRLSADWFVHIKWLIKQRENITVEAESILSMLVKNSQGRVSCDHSETSQAAHTIDDVSERNFAMVSIANIICRYTKKLEKVKNIVYEEELDDRLLYHIGRVVFFENKFAYIMGRRFLAEKMFLANPSVVARKRNLELIQKEEGSLKARRDNAIETLRNFKFEQIPLWENKVGFKERSRKDNQKAIISAVTSGNFVTFLVCFINTILLYRAPAMFLSICRAPHRRRKISLKTLKNYFLDFMMVAKALLICISIYKVPDLISALVISFVQKRSIKAARRAVDSIPSEIFHDLCRAFAVLFSWKSIAYTFSSMLFLFFMPLSVMVKICTAMFQNIAAAYTFSGLLYAAVIALPFVIPLILPTKIGISVSMSGAVAGYMFLLIAILIVFVLIHVKTLGKKNTQVKSLDYVRINWFNIHVYFKLMIEFVQLMALVFTVKMTHLKYREYFATASKYILLDVYNSEIKFYLACGVFVIWFFISSIPIILEGILKYVEKGTFSKSHFTWRAFLTFFGSTLFMVIPEVGLSFLACDYSGSKQFDDFTSDANASLMDDSTMNCWTKIHTPYAVVSLFGMMWYLVTSTLLCLTFNDTCNKKMDLQFSPAYTAIENIFKVGIVTVMTLFKDNIYSLITTLVLLIALILITWVWKAVTDAKVANYFRLIIIKVGLLFIVVSSAVIIIVVEMLEITGVGAIYGLAGTLLLLILIILIASISNWGLIKSDQEIARDDFKDLVRKIVTKLKSDDAFVLSWASMQFAFTRMLRHVRVANPKDRTFEENIIGDIDVEKIETLVMDSPPSYDELTNAEALPDPPSYEHIQSQKQSELQADEYFVPDASVYLSPFGEWEPYDAAKILEQYGWMIAQYTPDAVMELTDVQCTGADLLLLLEQYIKYTSHSYEFVKDIGLWRKRVNESTWTGLLHLTKILEESVKEARFEKPQIALLSNDPKNDMIEPHPDQSTFPMYFDLTDITSIKMDIHKRELGKLLSIIPEPWKWVFTKIIPSDKPIVKRVKDFQDLSHPTHLSVDLFREVVITIKNVDSGGFKIARGAKIMLPKTLNIINLSCNNIAFSKPYLSGSKGPITKSVDSLNAQMIGEDWYVLVGKNRAKFSKIVSSLHELQYTY